MKRKAENPPSSRPKKQKADPPPIPDYCDTSPIKDEHGTVWPASREAMFSARNFIHEAATSNSPVLIVPDKDADGLSSGVIIHRTLTSLGLSPDLISVHLISKGTTIHDDPERAAMSAHNPSYIIIVDQGSRPGPPIIDNPDTKSLIIDHHLCDSFPSNAIVVSACNHPPVATSALLTYELCKGYSSIADSCAYLCAMGTIGDLGTTLKWKPPFPDLSATFKEHTKKALNDAVSLLNAPRRTAKFDVISAWTALLASSSPKDLLTNRRLREARDEINDEIERRTHAAPKFSKDGKIAVLRIESAAQVHPVIATRWAGHLKSPRLEIVMVANSGYLPGMVNFSCRIARCARGRGQEVNIIDTLKEVAALDEGNLVERMGESFARGHREASGGFIPTREFEELMELIKLGEKPDKAERESPKKKQVETTPQKNNLKNYFAVKT